MHALVKKAAVALPAAALMVALAPTAASADEPLGVRCAGGNAQLSAKPGLTIVGAKQQTWTGEGLTTGCKNVGSGKAVTSAIVFFEGNGKGACVPEFGIPNADLSGRITWNGGGPDVENKVSNVTGTSKLTWTGANFTGVVTDGPFKGKKVNATASWDFDLINAVGGCFLGGYTSAIGTWDSLNIG